jgi:hypothetical protein
MDIFNHLHKINNKKCIKLNTFNNKCLTASHTYYFTHYSVWMHDFVSCPKQRIWSDSVWKHYHITLWHQHLELRERSNGSAEKLHNENLHTVCTCHQISERWSIKTRQDEQGMWHINYRQAVYRLLRKPEGNTLLWTFMCTWRLILKWTCGLNSLGLGW